MTFPFDNSYARLPDRFHAALPPTPVAAPELIAVNEALAAEIGIDLSGLCDADRAAIFSGNRLPDGATPIAQAYSGHQFGQWNPQLGDGRAILLGEVVGPEGRFDVQLKGSGPTPFSRRGDGRAWLGPVLREYVMSEAMAAIGVPTTRALAAVTTGEPVLREEVLPGAVLTRVARSHIRVGTFQYFAARGDIPALEALTDHVIARHYPDASGPEEMLEAVIAAQAGLIARWMSIGFIHGVMNTDNMSVAGETIDYGPCAFMDTYHPEMVFSSIDHMGRYAYANQPQIAAWNLAQLATSLLPLTEDQDAAIQRFTDLVHGFAPLYQAAWLREFGAKLGLARLEAPALVEELLSLMAMGQADFTNTFAQLPDARDQFLDREAFDRWQAKWLDHQPDRDLMARSNPKVIPRLHRIEAAITAGRAGDLSAFHDLLRVVTAPFDLPAEDRGHAAPPSKDERVERTFCGT